MEIFGKFLLILSALSFLQLSKAQSATCAFAFRNFDGDRHYSCGLIIDNPEGIEITELEGEHLEGYGDDDVTAISRSMGTIPMVPSVVCERFENVESIYLHMSGLTIITNETLSACDELKWLSLWGNRIESISSGAFLNNLKLEYLTMEDSMITVLPDGVFGSLVNLQYLHLRDNQFEDLPAGIFNNLVSLEQLLLDNTGLTYIDPNWFENLTNLTTLYINQNKIVEIVEPVFSKLQNLQILFLNNNGMEKFNKEAFSGLFSLTHLYLQFNNITDIEDDSFIDSENLHTLEMFRNSIENIEAGAFRGLKNLRNLNLERSQIHTILPGTFDGLESLFNLLLNVNHISDLPEGIFSSLSNIFFIGLWENNLRIIRRNIFDDEIGTLAVFDLDDNEIIGFDRRFFDDASVLDYLYLERNLCLRDSLLNIVNTRNESEIMMDRCFRNFEMIVESFTTTPSDVYTFHSTMKPGMDIQVQSEGEINLVFSSSESLESPLIEIFIGRLNNTRSVIRRNQAIDVVSISTPNVINTNENSGFRITWANHIFLVFKENSLWPFMGYSMSEDFDVNFYGLKTPETSAVWNIEPIWT